MTLFVRPSHVERYRAALPILLTARAAVVAGAEAIEAINTAGDGRPVIECWWARQVLLRVIPSATLQVWQLDSTTLQSDRTRAFDRAIRLARRAFGRRGGWVVSDSAGARRPGAIQTSAQASEQ